MKVIIKGEPKEIAALALTAQGRQENDGISKEEPIVLGPGISLILDAR